MERLKVFADKLAEQYLQIEAALKTAAAQIPSVGPAIADHIRLVIMIAVLLVLVILIKPLLKWSLVIGVLGGLVALAISAYFGLSFLAVLPYSAVGVSVLLLATK
jgi:hypothetical protein